jgi:hypothetical protein
VAITAALEKNFLDKAVDGLGLVVTLYDILSIGDGYVYHSDGGAHYRWVLCHAPVLLLLLLLLWASAAAAHCSSGRCSECKSTCLGLPLLLPLEPASQHVLCVCVACRVTFRVVVFRPFRDELLVGRVHKMTK